MLNSTMQKYHDIALCVVSKSRNLQIYSCVMSNVDAIIYISFQIFYASIKFTKRNNLIKCFTM